MGGIKNRDEKRKAAKVFSSGGGGGAKGPAIIDKRGQEEKCPHCDRVFKQNNRLKEHIAKQHADQQQDSTAAAAGTAVQQQPQQSGPGRPGNAGASSSSSSSSHQPAQAKPASAGSAGAGRPPAGSSSSSSGSSSARAGGAAPAAAAAGASSSSNSGGAMFDVGSRGGFYTEKSPKLLLHEWCMQQKRPRPKFKAVPLEGAQDGAFRARVVLPDPKHPGSDKDLVLWLDKDCAAACEEEAQQRGAVAALVAVAGQRSYDYLLPARYKPLWGELVTKAQTRAEAQARAAAAAAQAKAKQAAQRAASASRAPVAVVMSDKQRQAVEGLMQQLALDDSTGDPGAAAAPGSSSSYTAAAAESESEEEVELRRAFVDALVKAGFSAADATSAVRAVGTSAGRDAAAAASAATAAAFNGGRGVTRVWRSHDGLQPYLDWLCLALPVERLPARYRPGGSSGTVGVLRVNNPAAAGSSGSLSSAAAAAAAAAAEADDSASAWLEDPHVSQLVGYGYPADHAMAALQACGGSLLRALHSLQQQLLAGSSSAGGSHDGDQEVVYAAAEGGSAAAGVPAAWSDEAEVLGAIYGDELGSSSPGLLSLAVDGGEQVDGRLLLRVWCPCAPTPYPDAPPLLALSCGALPGSSLLALTASLAAAAQSFVGDPMVHELAVTLGEQLEAAAGGARNSQGQLLLPAPPPFDQPLRSSPAAGAAADGGADGYTQEAEQHAAAAEAIMGDDGSSSSSSSSRQGRQQRRRPQQQMSAEQQAAESRRLAEHFKQLQVSAAHASMRGSRARLPAHGCRQQVLDAVACNDVVVISGATGCGKSTQVPQYLFEQAVSAGQGGATNIIICQPRRIAAVGLATRVADEVGDPAGVGGLVGYSVRLDSKTSQYTRLLFCTTGVLLRRLMSDPQLTGVSHVVLDEVHERNLESDLLLLLLRRTLLSAQLGSNASSSSSSSRPPKVLLMSATADADLFAGYFTGAGPEALLLGQAGGAAQQPRLARSLAVGLLSIPGFTHPVRQMWLEDALQATGIVVGKQSRYAKRKKAKSSAYAPEPEDAGLGYEDDDADGSSGDDDDDDEQQQRPGQRKQQQQQQRAAPARPPNKQPNKQQQQRPRSSGGARAQQAGTASGGGSWQAALGGDAPHGQYSEDVVRSLQLVDASLIHYELIEALLLHIVNLQRQHGPAGLLKGWPGAPPGALEAAAKGAGGGALGAVLIFMPGAPEIDRLVRQLQGSAKLAGAAGHAGLRVLPLHGGLPASVQARVFERPPRGVLKVVVATNVAETSLTIDDVTCVIDTGRHKEMSYDMSRGLSRLAETWVSQAAAQQRRGRAGRVAPGVCYRLWPGRMWGRLDPQQPPEVLRVPLQQLCLTTKATLAAAEQETGCPAPSLSQVLSCLLTPPPAEAVAGAVSQLVALGALAVTPWGEGEALTPLGSHLCAMPMDAALGKALLYGCMLRCASPLLTIAAALGHGRPMWVNPPPDKRGEAAAARQALAPQ
eukprot:jgi/Sobl393_1/16814/SZX72388.1